MFRYQIRTTSIEDLGELAMHKILLKLSSTDVVSLSCVNSKLRVSASDDDIWSKFCADELDLTSPVDHLGNPIPTFKEAYKRWKEAFSMYPWPLVVRGKRCWDRIKIWFSANFPEAFATLRKGASEDELTNLENKLNVKLPLPTRLLYRFCDGQEFTKKQDGGILESWLGLIGGYVLFDQVVNVLFFSVRHVIEETKNLMRHLDFHNKSKYIFVASSSTQCGKYFVLDCDNGQLYVGTLLNNDDTCIMMPCVPKSLISSMHDCDAMLVWLEEHYRRLQNGTIRLRMEGENRYLNQFSEELPLCTTSVTNGVKVRASATLIPELCNLLLDTPQYRFAYSIRMSLLPNGCYVNGMHFHSCQLQKRSWKIHADDVIYNSIDESALGKYPRLSSGEEEYVYQSFYPLSTSSGSMEGSFTFVPGSLAFPRGASFNVKVERFPLKLPAYIF